MATSRTRRYIPRVNVRRPLSITLIACASATGVLRAQGAVPNTIDQWWPEVDYFDKISDHARFMLQALGAFGTNGSTDNQQYGLNFDFFERQPHSLARALGASTLVEDRYKPGFLRVGYRYSETVNSSDSGYTVQNRLLAEFSIIRKYGGFVVSDRNGFDWRWTNGDWSTRYRNRIYAEYTVELRSYEVTPYADAEWYYSLQNDNWSGVKTEFGVQLPVADHFTTEIYYGHMVNWNSAPTHTDALGITLVFTRK
jgi:hypothetical protein